MAVGRAEVHNVGTVGIVYDLPPHTLPPEAWSDGLNFSFFDDKASRRLGMKQVLGTASIAPYFSMGVPSAGGYFILIGGAAKVYAVVASTETWTDITRTTGGDYSMDNDKLWHGGLLGGIPVLNNGVDVPQYWSSINVGTPLTALPNFPASTTCKILRPFRNYLIALYTTESSVDYPHRVLWSHPADPGSVPSSWDVSDATKDAGNFDITDEAPGLIQDGRELGNQFIIYKELSAHRMVFRGGQSIWQVTPIKGQGGLLSQGCVSVVPAHGPRQYGGMHFLATPDDLVLFDGTQQRSVLSRKLHTYLGNSLSSDRFARSFTTADPENHQMLFFFPEQGEDWPNRVISWNFETETTAIFDAAGLSHVAPVVIEAPTGESDLWNDDSGIWNDDSSVWNTPNTYSALQRKLLGSDPNNTQMVQLYETNQDDGTNFTSFLERKGIALVGKDRFGNPKADFQKRKLPTRIWPKATGDPFYVRVGAQETIKAEVSWTAPQLFTPGTDQYLDLLHTPVSGRLLAVRFESSDNGHWELHGYDLDMTLLGDF